MQTQTPTSIHSDSSDDDDDLPSLPRFGNVTLKIPRKKTFDELFGENFDLINSQKIQHKNLEQIAALQIQDTLNNDDKSLSGDEANEFDEKNKNLLETNELDEGNESDTFEESVRLFGELNHLQFITWDDLTLQKCGFDSTLDLSELESLLIALNENELHEYIKCCEVISLKKLKQLNPFVQYVFKTMSIHSDAAYVNACQKFIKRMISKNHYIQSMSITDKDIFMVLFNYGIDVKKEIFNMLPGSKEVRTTKIISNIPKNWMLNMKAVLSSIGDFMKHCKMKENDLLNILIYFLWMSMDDFLNINMALQLCTEIILCRFSKANWPVWRLKIAQFVMSTKQWNLVLKMIKCIHHETPRGIELCNYLSYLALRKLTNNTSDSNVMSNYFIPKYSDKLFSEKTELRKLTVLYLSRVSQSTLLECVKGGIQVGCQITEGLVDPFTVMLSIPTILGVTEEVSGVETVMLEVENLQPILESICAIEKELQLLAIQFINLFIMSLKLSSKKEHSKLLILLKKCENSISKQVTIQQTRLCIIHSRISTLTPGESAKHVFDAVEKQEKISYDEEYASMHDLEIDSDTSQSVFDEQSLSEDSRADLITDQNESQEVVEELPSKERCAAKTDTIDSQFLLHEPVVNKQMKENSFFDMSKKLLQNEDNRALNSNVTEPLEVKKVLFEETNLKENEQKMNNITHLHALKEQLIEMPLNGSTVALELTVNSAISSPKTNSNIEASSERVNTESDRETESSSEREDCKSDEKMNSGTENCVTPSKSFLIDHRYTNKKWSNYLSVNPSKNLNTCFDKLSQGTDQCQNNKLLHECKNMLEVIADEIVKTVPNLNSHKTFKNCPQDFFLDNYPLNRNERHVTDSINIERSNINTEHCFNILSAGDVSAKDKKTFHSYQNSSAVQTSDIPEEPKAIELDSNVIKEIVKNSPVVLLTPINVHLHHKTEFETLKKTVKPAKETKHVNISSPANSLQDHYVKKSADEDSSACSIANSALTIKSEEMGNNFTLEPEKDTDIVNMELSNSLCSEISGQSQTENQSDLKMSQSKPMQNLISSQNLNSCSVSEDSRNDRSVISDIEHIDKGRPNEVNNTEATFISSEIEKLISEIQNDSFQSKTLQNPTSLQNSIPCSIAENSMDNRNFISNIEHSDKAKSSKLIKSYDVDNTETGFIDFKVDKIISEIDSTENKTLHNLTSLPNLVSCANSENLKDSIKNKNVISNIECYEKVRPSELIRSNETDNTDTVFIDSAVEKIISEIDSAENEALQNLTSLPNLISCAISENLLCNMNVISNIKHIDKVKPSGFIRSNEVDDIEVPIGSTFEKNITEITHKDSVSSESNSLPLLTKTHSNIPSSSSEELNYLENNTNISDKKCENVSKTIAENILLPSMTDASESSNNDVKIVPKFLNMENDKNRVNLQQKDIPISTPLVYIETSTRSVAVNENNNLVKNLACELTTPEVKKTDEPVKVSSVDSTKAEKLTSYPIIMRGKDLDPLYNMVNNPNPLDNLMNTTKKSKEDSRFIPRSVNIKTTKTKHSSDLRICQNSGKKSTSNFLNLVPNSNVERNQIFNTSEINNSVIDSEIDIKRREILQIPESNKTRIDKALKGIFTNQDEADERVNGTSFQPNIVHLRSVSDIGKINSSDNENHKKFCTPSLNILSENQKMPANNVLKATNKPTTGFNFDHNESSKEHQNIVFLSKQLSQAGASSKIQPHSVEFSAKKFQNTSCTSPKRKHTDSISNLASKRPRIPERLHLDNLAWTVNFPASLTPAENLNRKKEDKIDSVSLLTNNSSSVYFTEICNSQLANEIPGIRENSEVTTDHSNNTKSIKNQENSEVINTEDLNSKNLGDSDSGSSSDSDSGSSSDSDSSSSNKTSSSSKTKSSDSKSQSKVPNNQVERNNSLKDSQAAQSVVSDFVESIPSESEDEIQVIEEISNIRKNGKNKFSNSLSSPVMNKRQKCTSFNSTSQMRNQSLVKTPTKPKQSSQTKHPDMPRNRQISLFNFLEDACTDKLIKPKKSIKTEQKTPKKFDNLGQSLQKNPYSSSSSSSVKKPRLSQTSFTSVPHITSIPVSHSKASCSQNQDDIQCLNVDEDCFIIEQDNVHVITLD